MTPALGRLFKFCCCKYFIEIIENHHHRHHHHLIVKSREQCNTEVQRVNGKGKEEYLYSDFIQRLVSRRSDMDHTVLPAN